MTLPLQTDKLPTFEAGTVLLGRLAIALAAHFPEWVRRRTTTFTFLDEKAYEQGLDVNLRVPSVAWFVDGKGSDLERLLSSGELPSPFYVPLTIVRKGAVAAFRIADADGRTISMRNRMERCRLAVDAFSSLADHRGAEAQHGRPRGFFRPLLETIVATPDSRTSTVVLERALGGEIGRLFPPDDPYRQLLRQLAHGFMMLVPVSSESRDHLFHISWTERYQWSSRSTEKPPKGIRSRLGRGIGTLLGVCSSSLGWTAKSLAFDNHRIDWAQSTHFVVQEPDDAHNLHVALVPDGADTPLHEVFGQPRADVSVSRRTVRRPAGAGGRASVVLRLGPRRSGAFGAITAVAWVSAVLLLLVGEDLSSIDLEASTTIAVVLPALVAASLIRQGEHAIAGLLLAGVRICGLLVTLLVFAVAGFMATTTPSGATGSAAAACEASGIAGATAREGAEPPWTLLFRQPTAPRDARRLQCDVELDNRAGDPGTAHTESTVVRVATIGTLAIAGVLSLGMLATWWRVFLARRRAPRRDGAPMA